MRVRIKVLGSGEAFPDRGGNTAFWVECANGSAIHNFAIDCGYAAAEALFRNADLASSRFKGFVLTHLHADHCWGVIPALVRAMEEGRRAKIQVWGPSGVRRTLTELLELGYPGVRENLGYAVEFRELESSRVNRVFGGRVRAARTKHSIPNSLLRFEFAGTKFVISGDGKLTPEAIALARGSDLWFQECYSVKPTFPWHEDFLGIRDIVREFPKRKLHLTHFGRKDEKRLEAAARKLGVGTARAGRVHTLGPL